MSEIPSDKAKLVFLLVSGQKQEFLVNPTDTINQVCNMFYQVWPKEWEDLTKPNGPENLKILLRGKFLDQNSTIASNQIPAGQSTVVHLLVKNEATAEPALEEGKKGGCRCTIL